MADPKPAPATRDSRVRIALTDPDGAVFAWRRAYRFDPDVHDPDYHPATAALRDLETARGEYPDHEARLEVLVIDNPDATAADQTSSWRPILEEA